MTKHQYYYLMAVLLLILFRVTTNKTAQFVTIVAVYIYLAGAVFYAFKERKS